MYEFLWLSKFTFTNVIQLSVLQQVSIKRFLGLINKKCGRGIHVCSINLYSIGLNFKNKSNR